MRRLLLRSMLAFALASTAACADDFSEVVTTLDPSGEASSSGPGPVSTDTTVGADTTAGPVTGDSSSSGEPGTSSSGSSSSSSESTGGAVCGDGVVEADEACDGRELGGSDCIAQGFDGGELSCMADCSAFDTSTCTVITCGDDVIDGDDVCDGLDLAGSDCVAEGFDTGTLACLADCTGYDTTSCVLFSCGNDTTEGIEACDGTDLGGSTCALQGFDGGTLGCLPDCTAYDTTGCATCGDDVAAASEVCDGTDLAGSTCVTAGFDGGTLGCAADCAALDTSACFVCGDGVTEGTEVCDGADVGGSTCVLQGFDGGTLGCAADCAALDTSACYECGDGVAAGPEACDGDDLDGNDCVDVGFDSGTLACNAACGFDTAGCASCGDGVIGGGETCDGANLAGETCISQGFTFGALGCSSSCGFALADCVDITNEMEPNDDGMVAVGTNDFLAGAANGPYTEDTLIAAAIGVAGDDDVFAVSNPGPGYAILSLETFGPILGACDPPTDTVIELRTNTNILITSNNDSGIGACSLLSGLILPPGFTIYVRVIDLGDNGAIPGYHLHIRLDPVVCGDGTAGPGEQCDDGGVAPGDGCSATCVVEGAIQEIEPNASVAQADATGIVITGDAVIGGVIGAINDMDRFRIELAAPQYVRFETFTSVGRCDPGIATTLRLYDAAGVQIISDAGAVNGSGISTCAALVFPLPAGTFYVQVEESGNNSAIPTYLLEVALLGDAGAETEPNEDQLTANNNLMGGVSDVYVFGDHLMEADSDYYAIDVPVAGSSIRLELIEGDRALETCESGGIDSRITLYDPAGVQLVDDEDDGRGLCSLIDGTGTIGQDALAHDLAAGTYYVQVRATAAAVAVANRQFIYRLVATVRQP